MNMASERAWGDFWAQQSRQGGGGCLPEGYRGIDQVQQDAWRRFAKTLPRPCRLLDLATGDGRVMGWLMGARRDLKPIGVDLAPQLPPPPRGAKVKTNVPMEQLPFEDAKFEAVTSQFGFEYGDIGKAAAEIARVTRAKGVIGLMSHRVDGPILAHNLRRKTQIEWVLREQDLMAVAKRSLTLRQQTGLFAMPDAIPQAADLGAKQFGPESVGWEIAEAIRRTLLMGARQHPQSVAATLDVIASRAENEIGRIVSLEAACQTACDTARLNAAFDAAGLTLAQVTPLYESESSKPFADFRVLHKPG